MLRKQRREEVNLGRLGNNCFDESLGGCLEINSAGGYLVDQIRCKGKCFSPIR